MTLHMTLARRCAAIAAALALAAPPAGALPPRGADAPEVTAAGVDGQPVSTERFADQPLVLIFGEFDHEPTMQACAEVMDVLGEDRLRRPPGEAVVPILVVARQSAPAALGEHAAATRVPALVLHDPRREAFGAYRVLVIPSVVVVSGDRKVIYAAPGFLPRLRGLLRESLLVATGQQAPEQLDRALAAGDEGANGHESSRADRLIHLGEQLARHGMDEMAEARYREALALRRDSAPARVALGRLLLRQGEVEAAEEQFREALRVDAASVEGALGLVRAQLARGSAELEAAERSVRAVLERAPGSAEARYLLGIVLEEQGKVAEAAAAYRAALEQLIGG
jgi:tetratricopeptide (TPR) repeat protein